MSLMLCLILVASIALPGACLAENPETVSVAYIDYDYFIYRTDDGGYAGYAADYLDKIAQYTGWEYEFVDMDWPSAFEAVRQGEIDFYCVARQTQDRQEDFDFSLFPICNEEMNLYTLPDSHIYYEDYEALNGMRIGMLEKSGEIDNFDKYAKTNGFEYELFEYPLNEAAVEALKKGEVDAIALVNYTVTEGLKLAGNFGVSPAYMMSREGSPYMTKFSEAQQQLYFDEPGFSSVLEQTWYHDALQYTGLLMTRGEADYIAKARPLTVALSRDMAPIEYFDEDAGAYKGVTVDLFHRISNMTGLEFQFVLREDAPILRAQMEAGEVRLVGAMARDAGVSKALELNQTATYSESTFSLITRDMSALTPDSPVAVPAGYPMFADTARKRGYSNLREYQSMEACVKAVYDGDADVCFVISICEGYLLDHVQYAQIQSILLQDTDYGICLGVGGVEDSGIILSIINKCIEAIPRHEVNELIVSNMAIAKPKPMLTDIVVQNRFTLTALLVLIAGVIVLIVVYTQKAKRRRALEEKREQHHEFLQHLYNTLPCGVFQYAYESPHLILNYNAACARIYGYDGDFPVVGKPPGAVVEAGTEEAFQREFSRCEKAGGPISYIWPITRKDGSLVYTECVMDIVPTEKGPVFQEVVLDVTERVLRDREIEKRYSRELHRRDMRDKGMLYLAVFDVTEQKLVETDIDVPGIHVGMSVEEFVNGLRFELEDLQTKETMDDFATRFTAERLLKDYENENYEQSFLLCRRKDEQTQWVRSDLALRINPSDGHLMCFDYIWDVTDEYVTNEIVRRMAFADCECFMSVYLPTRRCLQYEVQASGELIRSQTLYGETDAVYELSRRMTQNQADEFIDATKLSVIAERLADSPYYQVYATLAGADSQIDPAQLSERGREDKSLSFFYINKDFGILAVTITDVTQVRASEVRHAELLSDALNLASQADEAKSQFLSRVSHEMRTPLNAIIGFMDLAKGTDAKTMENYLASCDAAAKQLLRVINDVLDMSSIESGKLKIAHAPFNLSQLISSITNVYGIQCKQKGVTFETRITTPTEEWLLGDELRINQILMNLLGNAVKFTSEGYVRLTITQTPVNDNTVIIRFEVTDSGCGMSEDMQKRLFTPFEQESAATANKYGGSGLGLSIVKSLVSLMNGVVRVESKQGEGTTFTIDLPFRKSEIISQTDLHGKVDHLRVLSVDDDESARAYMGLVLSHMGVRYTCVASGLEALGAMEKSERENDLFNVCLIDWRMPVPDGFDTTSMIRKRYGEDVILIVVSAYDFQNTGESIKASGANLLLSKPVFRSTLFDLFMTVTGGKIAPAAPNKRAWDFDGKRVLLAEDNEINQVIVAEYLERCNITVDLASNGQIALDKFTSSPKGYYDAILMDIQMPVMDGIEATKAIRESNHPQAKTIAIIAQTANAFNEDIAKALSAGMNAHIAKPIDPEKLYHTLMGLMGSAQEIAALSTGDALSAAAGEGGAGVRINPDLLLDAGVDYNMGVKRFGGKSEVYEKYLLKMFDTNPFISLKEQMEAGDCEAAFLTAHDLKGATGNLCLNRVFEKVSELTELLRAKELSDKAMALCDQTMELFLETEKAVRDSIQ